MKRPRSRRNVPLPPERDNRDAPFHQQRVAVEVGGSRRRVGVATEIEDERRHHAAVDDIDDCEIGRARGILGSKHHELAYGFHFPDRITRREREIDDSPVLGIVRIEREVHSARDPLVDARAAEGAGDVGASQYLDPDDARVGWGSCRRSADYQKEEEAHDSHQWLNSRVKAVTATER